MNSTRYRVTLAHMLTGHTLTMILTASESEARRYYMATRTGIGADTHLWMVMLVRISNTQTQTETILKQS